MDLHDFRRDYLQGGLRRADLNEDPIAQFHQWFEALLTLEVVDPTAMVLATANPSGEVSQRIVLLKKFSEDGFDFYTNKQSNKARDIAVNPKVSLHFPWHAIERQIIITGSVIPLTDKENDAYFYSRPRESQLAACASEQSRVLESRDELEARYQSLLNAHPEAVSRPDHWGGYRVVPTTIEFWQGGAHRLHDRFIYRQQADSQWLIQRLSP